MIPILEAFSLCDKNYRTKEADYNYWFKILNKEFFENALPECTLSIRSLHHTYGEYEGHIIDDKVVGRITLRKRFPFKSIFVDTVAHEMVHHHQFLNEGNVSHGKTFKEWKRKFKEHGIHL